MGPAIFQLLSSVALASPSGNIDLGSALHWELSGFQGAKGYGRLGNALATGDLNGDGHEDLVIGAYNGELVHIEFGPLPSGHHSPANSDAYWQGVPWGGEAGWAVAVGDLTNDGQDDLVVSEPSTLGGAGRVYVLAGPLAGGGTWYDKDHPQVAYSFEGRTANGPWYAAWEMAVGDFDGDGMQDLAMGICEANYEGPDGPDPVSDRYVGLVSLMSQADLTVGNHYDLLTDSTSLVWGLGKTGCAIANAGDTNGDGFDDIVVGSWRLSVQPGPGLPTVKSVGAATVIEGRETWDPVYRLANYLPRTLTYNDNPGMYTMVGEGEEGLNVGRSVSPAGDVDGDGYDDILIGAPAFERQPQDPAPSSTDSRVYLVYGASDNDGQQGFSQIVDVAGATFRASNSEHLGFDTSTVSDLDGDDSPELLLGGLAGAGYLFAGVKDPALQPYYTCAAGGGGCTVNLPATGGLQGTLNLSNATATFSGASSNNPAGSPDNMAGRTFIGAPDLTGSGAPSLVFGAPAESVPGSVSFPTWGHVYVLDGQ